MPDKTKKLQLLGNFDLGGSDLPEATEADAGKVLAVDSEGKPAWVQMPTVPLYDGPYSVTPDESDQTLETSHKALNGNITVKGIPYTETENSAGGVTVTIG
jgi:hypothetical protein